MSQTPIQPELAQMFGLAPKDETLAMLQAALETGMQAEAAAVDQRIVTAQQAATGTETVAQGQKVIDNARVNKEIELRKKVIGVLPAGGKILSSKNAIVETGPETGDKFISAGSAPPVGSPGITIDPAKVVRANIERAAGIVPKLDVRAVMKQVQGLQGDAYMDAISNAMISIGLEVSKHKQKLREQAEMQSGYRDAQILLQQNIQLDLQSPHAAVRQQGSYQTQQAQERLNSSLASAMNLTKALESSDPYIQELLVTASVLEKQESRRAQAEINRAGRQEDRKERETERLEVVPPNMVANLKLIGQSTGTDEGDKRAVLNRASKDKALAKILETSPDNMFEHLVDIDPKVRQGAFKILLETNRISAGLDAAPQDYLGIKKYVEDPTKLFLDPASPLGKQAKDNLRQMTLLGGTSKEKEAEKQIAYANALRAVVQAHQNQAIPGNLVRWRSSATAPETDLGKAIQQVANANPKGQAPLEAVIATYLGDPKIRDLTNIQQSRAEFENRKGLLLKAMTDALDSAPRSYLIPDVTDLKLRLADSINNQANRFYIRQGTARGYAQYMKKALDQGPDRPGPFDVSPDLTTPFGM